MILRQSVIDAMKNWSHNSLNKKQEAKNMIEKIKCEIIDRKNTYGGEDALITVDNGLYNFLVITEDGQISKHASLFDAATKAYKIQGIDYIVYNIASRCIVDSKGEKYIFNISHEADNTKEILKSLGLN